MKYALPEFVREVVHANACPQCHVIHDEQGVTGFGVGQFEGTTTLWIAVICHECYHAQWLKLPTRTDLRHYIAALATMVGLPAATVEEKTKLPRANLTNRMTRYNMFETDGVSWAEQDAKSVRLLSDMSPTAASLKIRDYYGAGKNADLPVLGGYATQGICIVMYRSCGKNIVPSDHLAMLTAKKEMFLIGFEENAISISDWPRFSVLKSGASFKVNGKIWRKLSATQLHQRVAGYWKLGRPK